MTIDFTNITNMIVDFVPILLLVSVVGWVIYKVRNSL